MTTPTNGQAKNSAIDLAHTEIDLARAEVALQVSALREVISRTFDWREWYHRRPGLCLASALALGFLIGRRI